MKGRVNKTDIMMECNKIIRMVPKKNDEAKIKMDQKALLERVESLYKKNDDKE